jgi:hypothetical protein
MQGVESIDANVHQLDARIYQAERKLTEKSTEHVQD